MNVFGGIIIGVTRHNLTLSSAADVFIKLSVGDGLVSQIPALIVSLAAGLLVSKGGTRGSAEKAVLGQLGNYPPALFVAAMLMAMLSLVPGLPFLPFAVLGASMGFLAHIIPKRRAEVIAREKDMTAKAEAARVVEAQESVKESLRTVEVELVLGKQLAPRLLVAHGELAHRVSKMRRKFAMLYGFVVPDIKVSDSLVIPPKAYQIKIHGTVVANSEVRIGDLLVVTGEGAEARSPI